MTTLKVFLFSFLFCLPKAFAHDDMDALKQLPVQDGGRIKPYDTFARESLQLIYGKQKFQDRSAVEVVTTWFLVPEVWETKKLIQISHRGLKEALKLNLDEGYFEIKSFISNDRISFVFQELQARHETKEKLDPYFQAVQRLQNQLGLFMAIKSGQGIRILPPPTAQAANAIVTPGMPKADAWISIAELPPEGSEKFAQISKAFAHTLPGSNAASAGGVTLDQAVKDFQDYAKIQNKDYAEAVKDIPLEVHYNNIDPFLITWILYLLSSLVMAWAWFSKKKSLYRLAWFFALAAIAMHIYGFAIRVYLTGRPPVSNMYESVVWVSFGAVFFSMIFEWIQKKFFVLLAGTSVAVLCLIVASQAPAILDSSLQPLEPVLRSNLWLSIHVLTITISYSAFFLAFALGDVGMFQFLKGEDLKSEKIKAIHLAIYRAMQVGVVLLAIGIIMGGIWADYSWGRFWGWDPKETWALIALLGYIAILHGRLAGWLREFGFIASSVISFSLVMMAWYGVNYVLGAGLHSYGFGAGGIQYVASFVLLHFIYVGYVSYVVSQRNKLPI
jgi:cytochrome c-type biogenesis protein CcsB